MECHFQHAIAPILVYAFICVCPSGPFLNAIEIALCVYTFSLKRDNQQIIWAIKMISGTLDARNYMSYFTIMYIHK